MPGIIGMPDLIERYFSSNIWLISFIISVIYLFFRQRAAGKRAVLAAIVVLFLFINQFVIRLFTALGENATFYRHLWAVPTAVIIGIAMFDLIMFLPKWFLKIPAIALVAVFLWFANQEYIRCRDQYFSVNGKMVSEDVISLSNEFEKLRDESGKQTLFVVSGEQSTELALYSGFLSVSDTSILSDSDHDGIAELTGDNPDVPFIMSTCCSKGMDYVITSRKESIESAFRKYGYEPIVSTRGCLIYKCTGYPGYKQELNRFGQVAWIRYHDEMDRPTRGDNGYVKATYEYDLMGNRIKESYFSENDEPVLNNKSYASVAYQYDKRAATSCRFFDENGILTISTNGYAGWDLVLGENKKIVKQTYVDVDGKPKLLKEGYASFERSYDDRDNITSESYLDDNGELIKRDLGYAIISRSYDEKNRLIKEIYYDANNEITNNTKGNAGFERIYQDDQLIQETKLDASDVDFSVKNLIESGIKIENVHIGIPGCSRTYHFLWLSDLHIVIANDEIAEDKFDFVRERQTSWAIRQDGMEAGEYWTSELAEQINEIRPDAMFFGGDMLDLCSEATVKKLKEGFDKITVPFIYIRADPDKGTHWLNNPDAEKNQQLQSQLSDNSAVIISDFPEFIILGVNNSTNQMTEEAVDQAKAMADTGKPIIVITHVPYNSIVDSTLDGSSRAAWQDRNLTWGTETSYVPDKTTSQWMEVVYEENSPVVEVLAGHLHLTWDGMVTEKVHEHIFSPGFSQYVGLITVDGNV